MITGRPARNSASPRPTPTCSRVPNRMELASPPPLRIDVISLPDAPRRHFTNTATGAPIALPGPVAFSMHSWQVIMTRKSSTVSRLPQGPLNMSRRCRRSGSSDRPKPGQDMDSWATVPEAFRASDRCLCRRPGRSCSARCAAAAADGHGGGRPARPVARRPGRHRDRPFALHQRPGRARPSAPAARPGRCRGGRGRHGARRRSAAHRAAGRRAATRRGS